jgi:hypothetical protein
MADDASLVRGVIEILRGNLNHIPLSQSFADDELRADALLLLEQIKAGDSEGALRQTVAKIQIKHRLPVNDQKCKIIVASAIGLVQRR